VTCSFKIKITKIPVLFSGAETCDNICKKKGKKKNFFRLTFTFISYCHEHQVIIIKKINKKNNYLIIRYIKGMSCLTTRYKSEKKTTGFCRKEECKKQASAMA